MEEYENIALCPDCKEEKTPLVIFPEYDNRPYYCWICNKFFSLEIERILSGPGVNEEYADKKKVAEIRSKEAARKT